MNTDQGVVRVGTWNTRDARPDSPTGGRVSAALADPDCDILCVTKGSVGILPAGGHHIDAGPDWGYPPKREGRRRVLLWSKRPWIDVDPVGSEELPNGRFVAGVTETPLGLVSVVGVCIPWDEAHVDSGRKDRELWQDHLAWLTGFERFRDRFAVERTIVLGDFNQHIPRKRCRSMCTRPCYARSMGLR